MDLRPSKYNLPAVTQGDTYPASLFTYDGTGALARVRMKVKAPDGAMALDLDSDSSGITVTVTTAGAWAWQMDEISATDMEGLAPACYKYDLETTTSTGTVSTLIAGDWPILPQITD